MPASKSGLLLPVVATWFVAFNLRSVIIALPPVLPEIRSDLHLSFTTAGLLGSLPSLCLAVGAIPGVLLTSRFGFRVVLGLATLVIGVGAVGRLLPPETLWLVIGTVVLSLGVATAQPALSPLARDWFPERVERVVSAYTNGMSVGVLCGASLTPYMLVLGGWRTTFALWGLPALAASLVWFLVAPRPIAHEAHPHRLRSLLRAPEVWRAAAIYGTQNLAFYTTATWIPFLIHDKGEQHLALVLLVMNAVVLVPTFILALVSLPYATSRLFYFLGGAISTLGSAGLAAGLLEWDWLLAGLVGLGTGVIGIAALALPSVRARTHEEVVGYSGLMLTLGYALSFSGPMAGGLILEHTRWVPAAFLPAIPASILIIVLGMTFGAGRGAPTVYHTHKL